MKGTAFLIFGLLLIALAALWFLSPVSEIVLQAPAPERELSTRGIGGSTSTFLNWAEVVVDGLNAFFGAFGFYLSLKGWRLRRSEKEATEEKA